MGPGPLEKLRPGPPEEIRPELPEKIDPGPPTGPPSGDAKANEVIHKKGRQLMACKRRQVKKKFNSNLTLFLRLLKFNTQKLILPSFFVENCLMIS